MTSALIEHGVVIFSTFPFEINKDKRHRNRQRKQTENPSQRAHPSFLPPDQLPFLVGTHIKYIRSSKGGIAEIDILICPEKASVVSNTELLGRKLVIIIWWSDRFLQWTEKRIFALYARLQPIWEYEFVLFLTIHCKPHTFKNANNSNPMWHFSHVGLPVEKTTSSWGCIVACAFSKSSHSHP